MARKQQWRHTIIAAEERAVAAKMWFQDAVDKADLIDMADSIRIGTQCANQAHQLMQQGLREREAAMFPPKRARKAK